MHRQGFFNSSIKQKQHHLTEELFKIVCGSARCNETDIKRAHELISGGADVCYFEGGETIIHGLIAMRDIELLKTALRKNVAACRAIPRLIYNDPQLTEEENYFLTEQDPLHKAAFNLRYSNTKTNNDIYQLIAQNYDISNRVPALYKCIENLYQQISILLKNIFEHRDKRPILILFGENHDSLFSSFVQCIVIFVAHTLGVNKIFREEDRTRLTALNNDLESIKSGGYTLYFWKSATFVRSFINKIGLHISPSDHGSDGNHLLRYDEASNSWQYFEGGTNPDEGLRYRNSIIANEYRKYKSSESSFFAEVGSLHLYGLDVEEHISNDFNVIVFDSDKLDINKYRSPSDYYCASEQYRASGRVINLTRCIDNFGDIVCLLNAIHRTWLLETVYSCVVSLHSQEVERCTISIGMSI